MRISGLRDQRFRVSGVGGVGFRISGSRDQRVHREADRVVQEFVSPRWLCKFLGHPALRAASWELPACISGLAFSSRSELLHLNLNALISPVRFYPELVCVLLLLGICIRTLCTQDPGWFTGCRESYQMLKGASRSSMCVQRLFLRFEDFGV